MKKIIKYSLYGLVYLSIIFVLALFFISTAKADLIKPNNSIEPYQVLKIQLRSLKKNDDPYKDSGITQTWEFAHPNNQKITGPLSRFKKMLNGDFSGRSERGLQKSRMISHKHIQQISLSGKKE